ncbi:MAG TPA: diguanylate cyclase [Verrucomicrobiae bacterium]|jgi:diguanylate cyclase (GGDEF)-like protein/PAS domain S-box-containing protein|nr:diguanylate cyclase [Verrucomicrobiae bacterium]
MPELNDPEIYRSVLEHLETGVYIVDRNRRVRFWNEGAEQITGFLRQDVVGRFLREHLLAVGDASKALESDPDDPINLAFRDGKSTVVDVSILHKSGYRIPVVLRTNPIRNSRGAVVGVAESFERNRSASDWTRRQAMYADFGCMDSVTGLAAQSFMETQLRENLIAFGEHNIPFGILLIQVDHLDQFRATRGPGVVPTILRVVAQSLENCLRPTDLVGCWGENQFLAVLMECRESEVVRVGERVRKIISMAEIEWWGDRFSVTSPVGGAGCRAEDTVELLVERAAASLQDSIEKGGNCVVVLS